MGRVTIKDIARIAGVSYTTVSRALNDGPEINPATRARILDICQQEGYHANLLARSLICSRSNVLGLIIPAIDHPFFSELALWTELCAQEHGYSVMLCGGTPGDGQIESVLEFLASQQVDGILLTGNHSDIPALAYQSSRRIPTVLLGDSAREEDGLPIDLVGVDNVAGGRRAAEYLHSLGHRDIVYLGPRATSSTYRQRIRGFMAGARDLGLSVEVIENPGPSSTIERGYQLAKPFFLRDFTATAIFAASDAVALGIMQAADELDISIPQRVSLLGFDNISYAALPKIRLTTFDQRKQLLAQTAVELLLERIATPAEGEYVCRRLVPPLVERDTCRAI